ncbi:hypothetical protein GF312_09370, partial [Candidatus Poribacteria bacterium]|nr:hypothetical protein [Candidatus Poribacteria bacterium]
MISTIIVRKSNTRLQFFLISLCIHMAAFLLMGSFVLHNIQKPKETMNVQLLKSVKQIQRRRHNILKPPIQMMERANLPDQYQDIARPKITQSDV